MMAHLRILMAVQLGKEILAISYMDHDSWNNTEYSTKHFFSQFYRLLLIFESL